MSGLTVKGLFDGVVVPKGRAEIRRRPRDWRDVEAEFRLRRDKRQPVTLPRVRFLEIE